MATALITGANRGLGLALAKHFLTEQWNVLATCREEADREGLRKECPSAAVHQLDVGKEEQVRDLAGSLNGQPIDILINNAAWAIKEQGFLEFNYVQWERSMRVNAFSLLSTTKYFLNSLLLGDRRMIIYISSFMGSIAENQDGGSYCYRASKAAGNMLVRNLALELKHAGVTVLALHPGWVRTRLGGEHAPVTPEASATGIHRLVEQLTSDDSGNFYSYTGEKIKW